MTSPKARNTGCTKVVDVARKLQVGSTLPAGPGAACTASATILRALATVNGFLNLVTRFGPLDVTFVPDGTDGFPDLTRDAATIRLLDVFDLDGNRLQLSQEL